MILTAHQAVDLDRVYGEADLVVDTVNSSAGRTPRDRQVLRLRSRLGSRPETDRPATTRPGAGLTRRKGSRGGVGYDTRRVRPRDRSTFLQDRMTP